MGALANHGRVLTEHVGAPRAEAALGEVEVHDRDLRWLRQADVLVAEVTTPSLGVGYEIAMAESWGKPVLCLLRPDSGRRLSAMIAGAAGVRVEEYGAVEEAEAVVADFMRTIEDSGRQDST